MATYLLYSGKRETAREEIHSLDGRVTQQLTANLFLAVLPDSYDIKKLKFSRTGFPKTLSKTSRLVVKAWRLSQKKREKYIDTVNPNLGLLWGAPGVETPVHQKSIRDMIAPEVLPFGPPPTSRQMTGSVAIGIIIVSGPGSLAFTSPQRQKILAEVMEALQFLSTQEPRARLVFYHDLTEVHVTAPPGPTTRLESAEAPWRNEALGKMGFNANKQGSIDYVNDLRQRMRTDWAYVVFFTKYTLAEPYYTVGERIMMHYKVDDVSADNISTVFAHESCHVFGAGDEYPPCACADRYGELQVPNGNCKPCTAHEVPCLMLGTFGALCDFTRRQIGWDITLFP